MCGDFRADPTSVPLESPLTSDGLRPVSALPAGCHSQALSPALLLAAEDSSAPCAGQDRMGIKAHSA